jgi:NADPH-dependent curcumin reductase
MRLGGKFRCHQERNLFCLFRGIRKLVVKSSGGPNLSSYEITKSLTLRGFINYDFIDLFPDFLREVGHGVQTGEIRYREDIVVGLENAPQALMGMLDGRNFGKLIVRVS